MSYQYRKKKRKLCHVILKDTLFLKDGVLDDYVPDDYFEERSPTIDTLQKWYTHYTFDEINSCLILLQSNKHIKITSYSKDLEGEMNPYIVPTLTGIEAYNEGYYEKENQKDRLECIELYTKWILPSMGICISLVALFISIFKK